MHKIKPDNLFGCNTGYGWHEKFTMLFQPNSFVSGINNYPSELRISMLAHIIKITVCYGRAELGLSIKLSYFAQIFEC